MDTSTVKLAKSEDVAKKTGHCLGCGTRLSLCGRPFTVDLQCPCCGAINAYVESFQPVRLKATVEQFDVRVAA